MRLHYLALHEPSGYAVAAQRCMRALRAAGVELRWIPYLPGTLGYRPAEPGEVDDPALQDLLAGPAECDAVVAHLVPEYWPSVRDRYAGTPLVGHTVWETDRLPATWPALLDVAERILVPTAWNAGVIARAGVRAPVAVVPHVAAWPSVPPVSSAWDDVPASAFVVSTVGPWTARKALDLTLRAYQAAFVGRDDTLLVLKTSPRDFTAPPGGGSSRAGPGTTGWSVARLLGGIERPAPVRLVTGTLADDDLAALHARSDCYLSLCRSEGWGIPAFDAAAAGTPIVITGFGGQLDYLDAGSAFLVDHALVPVDDPAGGASYTPDQRWAEPSVGHAAALLRQVAGDPAAARVRAARARDRVRSEFAPDRVAHAFLAALDGLVP
jgi:glycosyltransferase involved in cell wall biosynthesis